jgi:hypothetical protein
MTVLERTKKNIHEGYERRPHTQYNLLGNAACNRIIKALIMAYISNDATLSTCKNNEKSLMIESVFGLSFEKEIMPEITTYFKTKEHIEMDTLPITKTKHNDNNQITLFS